ncbi:ABC transporter ATP-binding protein [Chloroflexota bacterium]
MAKDNILKIEDLSVVYGPIRALQHVSLEVNEGEIVTLIGANGAGKSTLLESILNLHHVVNGTITFMGENITKKPTDRIVAGGIVLIPEGRGILSLMTVLENLQLGAYHLKGDISPYRERVFNRFPVLNERKKQMGGTLSGGEQQMLSIGRGLMSSPKLIMLDEPSLGLAPVMVDELFEVIVELNEAGHTVLLSEQNARKALACSHRAYVFEIGRVMLSGASQKLADDPAVKAYYLGG